MSGQIRYSDEFKIDAVAQVTERGFWGRWQSYALNGHGGNKLLRPKVGTNFQIAILEVTSSAMTPVEIIGRENLWKQKLGSRAHGLNAN